MKNTFLSLTADDWLAIVGGVYAFATLALAWFTNRASIRATGASRYSVDEQIKAAATSLTLQLEATRDAAVIQARASSVSNNRQGWINSLRDEVTGFLTDADMAAVVRDEMPISAERTHEQFRSARALTAHIFKVRLLINPTEGESTDLVELMTRIEKEGIDNETREQVVQLTQTILKVEWERVKSGD